MSSAETYFIAWKGRRDGPFSLEQLAGLLQRGDIGLLHRVETTAGPMPLRQLLLAADPARWSNLAVAPGLSKTEAPAPSRAEEPGPIPPPPTNATTSNPLGLPPPTQRTAYTPSSAISNQQSAIPSSPSQLATRNSKPETSSDDSPDALRAYIVSGLTFLCPPLAWYGLKLAKNLGAQGQPQLAQRLLYLNYGLAATGLLFWLLLWRLG